MASVKVVDPLMDEKKKGDKIIEVQNGWKGHILPFDLVQRQLLSDDLSAIDAKKDRLSEIPSEYDTIIESLSEDDKETISDALNDTNDEFVTKNIPAMIKTLKADDPSSPLIAELQKAEKLNKEEKSLKSEVKKDSEALVLKTKETIENLRDAEVKTLLQKKWIAPIIDGIEALPDALIEALAKKVTELSSKYSDTYQDIENEIHDTEKSLSEMMSELTGSLEDIEGIEEFRKMLE